MRYIYLVRHGELLLKSEKPCCLGVMDVPLAEKGIRQAERLRKYFQDKDIEVIYTSPLIRSLLTAEIISRDAKKIIIEENLREIDMGDWDGMSFEEIKLKYPQEYSQRALDLENFSSPGGESFRDCLNRSKKAFLKLVEGSYGNIAIVAHAGVNRALLCWMMARPLKKLFELPQPYGCINIIEYNHCNFNVIEVGKFPDV